jgi:AcrR family transcriptional regulator
VRAIVAAAARVFAAHGWAAGTTNRIAARAGVSVGSLYEYFADKEAVLAAVLDQHVAEAEGLLAELDDVPRLVREPLAALVGRWVAAMVALHAREPALHRVVFEEAPIPHRVRRRITATEAATARRLAAVLRAHPEVAVPDPGLAAAVVVQVVEALTHWLVLHPPVGVAAEDAVREIGRLVCGYLTGPGSARRRGLAARSHISPWTTPPRVR